MKNLKKYIYGALAVAIAAVMPSCQDHFDEPSAGEQIPVATKEANTTLLQLKEWMWSDSNNYCDTVFTREWYTTDPASRTEAMKTEGTHVIVKGRVVSSDYAGNCFKYIVLQDETAALNFSINSYNLYLNYRVGQEIVVDLTGLHAGKYRGLEQIGFPSYNSSLPGYETSFMAPEMFSRHAELNGLPDVSKVDTTTVERFSDLGVTPAELRKWQSRLVRFNNVEFVPNATTPTLSTYHSSGVTQQIRDNEGNTLDVRTSGYANFWNMELPEGKCDVVALLGYYVNLAGTGGWQLTLLDINSIMNVGDPTVPKGSESNPYSVDEAVAFEANSQDRSGWVKGYIVGTVAPEVETVSSSADIEWGADATLRNTLVIGQAPDTKNITRCLVVSLPQDSELQKYGALRENPDNLGKEIVIRGTFAQYMGTFGLTGNNGTSSEFRIEGKNVGPVKPEEGDGTEAKPYNCNQIIAMNPSSTTVATASNVWVSGYIVGYYEDYAGHFEVATKQRANILIADTPEADNTSRTVCVQLVAQTDVRNALNLVDNPGVLGSKVSVYGDVMKYNTLPGIKNTSQYKLDGTPTPPIPGNAMTLLGSKEADGNKDWTFDNVDVPASLQYPIWQWTEYNTNYYLKASAYIAGTNNKSEAWAISPIINMTSATGVRASFDHAAKFQTTLRSLCGFAVREDGSDTWHMLTIPTWPEAGTWTYVNSGDIDLSAYSGKKVQVAFKYASSTSGADTWQVRDLKFTYSGTLTLEGAGQVNPPTPPSPGSDYKGDFDSFNGGTPKSTYGTYTNATGWEAVNSAILSGLAAGATEQNPRFAFIGSEKTLAVCLNGKVSAPGTLTSPVISGGIRKLTYNYGFAFADTKCTYKIQFIQNGSVVKEETVTLEGFTTKTAYEYSLDNIGITGDFQIKFVNACVSNKSGNGDRIAIWNLTWE